MSWGLLAVATLAAQAQPLKRPVIAFATIEQGRKLLSQKDDFVTRLSPFDRAARMKTDRNVSQRDYLRFVRGNVLAWTPAEEVAVESAWAGLEPKLTEMLLPFPEKIYFVKTTGAEEGDQEYTRANALIFPESALAAAKLPSLKATIAHELFHVLSRNAPELRDELYAVIGFRPCGEVPFPPALVSRRITDPDAPRNDHCILVQTDTGPAWTVPILFSKAVHYDVAKGGQFFQYAQLKLLVVQRAGDSPSATAHYDPANVRLLDVDQVHGFYEQVGRNTNYTIHPEEILADNFRLLLLGEADVRSPEVLQNLATALKHSQGKQ